MQIQDPTISSHSLSSANPHAETNPPAVAGGPDVAVNAAVRHAAAAAGVGQPGAVAAAAGVHPQTMATSGLTGANRSASLGTAHVHGAMNPHEGNLVEDGDAAAGYHGIPTNGPNFSSDFVIHPSQLVDPGSGRGIFISIYIGRPVGIITDVVFFFELLKCHREMAHKIFETFKEGATHYETLFNHGSVRLGEHLAIPLPMLFPGGEANPIPVSSAAPTPVAIEKVPRNRHLFPHTVVGPHSGPSHRQIDPQGDASLASPTPLPNASARVPATASVQSKPKEVVDVPSSDEDNSQASSSEEEDEEEEHSAVDKVEVIDTDDDDRPAHIPNYPRAAAPARAASPLVVVTSHTTGRLTSQAPTRLASPFVPVTGGRATSQGSGNPVRAFFDSQGIYQINPLPTDEPLGRNANPSLNFSHPDVNPNPFPTATPTSKTKHVLTAAVPASAPVKADTPEGAKKRRRAVIDSVFSKDVSPATASAVSGSPSIFAGNPVAPVASSSSIANSTRARTQKSSITGAVFDIPSSGSESEWGLVGWTHEELDAAGPALGHPSTAAASSALTRIKPKKSKAKGKAKEV